MMALGAMAVGGIWIGTVGALRNLRGVNETISSLLMAYIAIALMNHLVEGPFRDPLSLNKPSTAPLPEAYRVGEIPGIDVHWGLAVGILACIVCWVLIEKTTWGFAARIVGGNVRAAQVQGLPTGSSDDRLHRPRRRLRRASPACSRLRPSTATPMPRSPPATAIPASSSPSSPATTPLAIIPVAVLFAGFEASSGLVQRRMDLPDATILVLEGIVFVAILLSETLSGRFRLFQPELWRRAS